MSYRVLGKFHFLHGIQVELLADDESPRLVCRLGIPEGLYAAQTQEEALPLGNALELQRALSSWLEWHETCHRCDHPRREHFQTWAAGLDLAGCAHDSDGDVRALPCPCRGIDR